MQFYMAQSGSLPNFGWPLAQQWVSVWITVDPQHILDSDFNLVSMLETNGKNDFSFQLSCLNFLITFSFSDETILVIWCPVWKFTTALSFFMLYNKRCCWWCYCCLFQFRRSFRLIDLVRFFVIWLAVIIGPVAVSRAISITAWTITGSCALRHCYCRTKYRCGTCWDRCSTFSFKVEWSVNLVGF